MTREELSSQLERAGFTTGDMVYVARAGEEYRWYAADQMPADPEPVDAWIYYSGRWPVTAEDFPPFFEDMLAEMEAMAGGFPDRCRWSLDEPWPHMHH